MFSADRLLTDLIGSGLSGGLGGKRYRYRGGRGMGDAIGRTVMSPQGLTILGGLAIAAYEHFKASNAQNAGQPGQAAAPAANGPFADAAAGTPAPGSGAPAATPPPFTPSGAPNATVAPTAASSVPSAPSVASSSSGPSAPAGEERARLLVSAMVSAAKADGTIDPDERARIMGRLDGSGAGDADRAWLDAEMTAPLDIDRLVARAQDPLLAAEVYSASLLAIDPDTAAERAYLAMLAARLNLDPGLVRELETRLDTAGA